MLFLRSVTGITGRDKIKDYNIDNNLHADILNDLIIYRQDWKSYVQRMTGNRIPKQMVYSQLRGTGSRRRPRKA
jgi:hypothetical protein